MATTTPTEQELVHAIKSVYEKNPEFGSKRILAAVKGSHADWLVGEKRISKLLKKLNLAHQHHETPQMDNQSSDDEQHHNDNNASSPGAAKEEPTLHPSWTLLWKLLPPL
ncbi:hypothetical protein H310_14420 [Aphanomyces invadans]|uniref:Uncharacterized protein n=1 Tax=Aphanomyces invadans TaxID=157072 RepID=A0A024T9Z4_9STRA|nr:hypothetical protein H310_14420 [Aphanomyces invadans]ETV90863.1 hypothetical protein H310_14420 [Aphanomyces invadans]|eukprot:XP_008880499.1 hypothetical protein H310_14420 [Aphanomyces invadans]